MGATEGGGKDLSGILVSDTGPILHLHEARALDVLGSTGQVAIPPEVDRELALMIDGWTGVRPSWLTVERLTASAAEEAEVLGVSGLLDAGEAEALALARQLAARWFLTDDAAARVLEQIGLEVHGSLGVVLGAAAEGALVHEEASRALTALFGSTLWVSQRVRREALAALDLITRRRNE